MKVKIKAKGVNFSMPVPIGLAFTLVNLIPEVVFNKWQEAVPEPYCCLVQKEYVKMIVEECAGILKENKGLEVVDIRASDGTYVYIRL